MPYKAYKGSKIINGHNLKEQLISLFGFFKKIMRLGITVVRFIVHLAMC
jgi:hypothetical protein